ncbi:hypothetical protein A2U01_0036838, partial [Trifolium medium]|nr:hypothetical protein [Trifolium medium]
QSLSEVELKCFDPGGMIPRSVQFPSRVSLPIPSEPPDAIATMLLNMFLLLSGTKRFTATQCHNIAAHRLFPSTLQVFAEMPMYQVVVWNANFSQFRLIIPIDNGLVTKPLLDGVCIEVPKVLAHEPQHVHPWSYWSDLFHVGCSSVLANIHRYFGGSARV